MPSFQLRLKYSLGSIPRLTSVQNRLRRYRSSISPRRHGTQPAPASAPTNVSFGKRSNRPWKMVCVISKGMNESVVASPAS